MIHINAFLDKLRIAETKRNNNITLSMTEAKNLHTDITKLLLALQELHEKKSLTNEEIIEVEVNSENW